MRLPDNAHKAFLALGLSALLAACGGGSGGYDISSLDAPPRSGAAYGPEADYPQVLGEPFTVDGQLFTPEDTYSYDTVGYAAFDGEGGQGVSVAHKTLPMPSYVEVTSLETGRTILARVDRRGPMTSQREVALSPGAAAQLGIREGEPVRVRRVNPPEAERAELRMGKQVPERLATPDSLLAVLKKKLPADGGFASLAGPSGPPVSTGPVATAVAPSAASTTPVQTEFDRTFGSQPAKANKVYPLPPLPAGSMPMQSSRAAVPAAPAAVPRAPEIQRYSLPGVQAAMPAAQPVYTPLREPAPALEGKFAVQAAAFSSEANAKRLAAKLDGGFVTKSGSIYRVRCGPYATRGQAEAALAKVRAAGYSDAQVVSAG
ncbi:SPOR domain-containing protein [Erythrobacter sp. SDW2]|uniref:SPOR domain-containing protein n=1 Tax=Erythrobacter sp. SDW2 TaxID=2907154 RepID=UPI001F342992|nr:SPOR domain-containing protein [Erythrobacter sp. SDW2]UIP05765.1 SPOR domain-containing protein [Erythrobacter sp. SDW2]